MSRLILPEPGDSHLPIRVWGRTIPPGALELLRRVAAQPYVVGHVAAMPDLHVAKGVAVGTVFATEDAVVPVALGGDLGCGMSAVRFDLPAARLSQQTLSDWLTQMAKGIPVGDATHRGKGVPVPDSLLEAPLSTGNLEHVRERLAPKHLGTLGGGNHFIELDRDGGGDLWLLVHSGSRGLGAAVAAHHLRVAELEGTGEIAGLRVDSAAGAGCVADIDWTLRFARANRDALLAVASSIVADATGVASDTDSRIDVHHNFVNQELHQARRVWVHRKGAISAPRGAL